jgi:hypothetical protein
VTHDVRRFGWFGWRIVRRPRGREDKIGHAFRTDMPGSPSLCGKVRFGMARDKRGTGYRPCSMCSTIWSKKYPPKDSAK